MSYSTALYSPLHALYSPLHTSHSALYIFTGVEFTLRSPLCDYTCPRTHCTPGSRHSALYTPSNWLLKREMSLCRATKLAKFSQTFVAMPATPKMFKSYLQRQHSTLHTFHPTVHAPSSTLPTVYTINSILQTRCSASLPTFHTGIANFTFHILSQRCTHVFVSCVHSGFGHLWVK